jgi:hypothetical protein
LFTGVVSTLAGEPPRPQVQTDDQTVDFYQYNGVVDGLAPTARFSHPVAVALGPDGVLYVADRDNNSIRLIGPAQP